MDEHERPGSASLRLLTHLSLSPYATVFIIFTLGALLVLFTRICKGYSKNRQESEGQNPEKITILPYWIPYIGHAPSAALSLDGLVTQGRYVFWFLKYEYC
jgi:hypothetical protein